MTALRRRSSCKGRARRVLTAAEHPAQAVYWEARRIKCALSTTTPCRTRSRSKLGWLLGLPSMMPLALEVAVAEVPFWVPVLVLVLGLGLRGFFSAALFGTPDEAGA